MSKSRNRAPEMTIALAIMLEMRDCEVAEVFLDDDVLLLDAYARTGGKLLSRDPKLRYCRKTVLHNKCFETGTVHTSTSTTGTIVPRTGYKVSVQGEELLARWAIYRRKQVATGNEPKTLSAVVAKSRAPIAEAIIKAMARRKVLHVLENDADLFTEALGNLERIDSKWRNVALCVQTVRITNLLTMGGVRVVVDDQGVKKPVRYYILTKAGYTLYVKHAQVPADPLVIEKIKRQSNAIKER